MTILSASSFLAVLVVLSLASTADACTAKGQNVTASGYVMDNLCIKLGTLMDNPSVVTLLGPEKHTIHCLVDVKPCVDSNYALLAPPATGSDMYSVKYQLGLAGTTLAKSVAENARSLGGKGGLSLTVTGIDDGTPELKCVEISKSVIVDGKALTLPANVTAPSTTKAATTTAAPTTTVAPTTTNVAPTISAAPTTTVAPTTTSQPVKSSVTALTLSGVVVAVGATALALAL